MLAACLRIGRTLLAVRRLADVARAQGLSVRGVMGYEGHVVGLDQRATREHREPGASQLPPAARKRRHAERELPVRASEKRVDLRADAGINSLRGVGVSEAPRGTLFHDYTVDRDGLLKKVNLIIATGQNNLAMNQTVAQIARHYVRGNKIPEPMLNRVEHGIRCYDPCLSCSTHAVGQMPLHVRLVGPDGAVLHEVARG